VNSVLLLRGDSPPDVQDAADRLRRGQIGGVPTETVYGLAGSALQPVAVARIFEAKQRPSFDPLIVHVLWDADAVGHDEVSVHAVADVDAAPWAKPLMDAFWPGPLTLVLPRRQHIPDLVTSGLETVAVRAPAHPTMKALIRLSGQPLAAPSANPFGYVSPTTAQHVAAQLGERIDFVVDGGPCAVGVESTIVAEEEGRLVVLRHGGIPMETLAQVVGPLVDGVRVLERPLVPGQLARHYATRTPLVLVPEPQVVPSERRALVVVSGAPSTAVLQGGGYEHVLALSPDGDLVQAAARLFEVLRALDELGLGRIDVVGCQEVGLGRAIMDRLRRAAAVESGH
jgi:L-threonylcarbamoyladenylate synthase